MRWFAINEQELVGFHMAAALQMGRNVEAQAIVNEIRAREISYTKERRKTVKASTPVQHRKADICPYGKFARSQCTPTRAEDCSQNDVCGKGKRSAVA
jgi:hypothetical protein